MRVKIDVEIKGNSPGLLMHNPTGKNLDKISPNYNPEEEAEKSAYRKKSGELYIPAEAVYHAMVNSAIALSKANNKSLASILAGSVRIEPSEIGLGTRDYEIDSRTVIQKGRRIPIARARVFPWRAKFFLICDEDLIPEKAVKTILQEAGRWIGILSYRPACGGQFGTFEVTKWQRVKL